MEWAWVANWSLVRGDGRDRAAEVMIPGRPMRPRLDPEPSIRLELLKECTGYIWEGESLLCSSASSPPTAQTDRLVVERWLPALGFGDRCPRVARIRRALPGRALDLGQPATYRRRNTRRRPAAEASGSRGRFHRRAPHAFGGPPAPARGPVAPRATPRSPLFHGGNLHDAITTLESPDDCTSCGATRPSLEPESASGTIGAPLRGCAKTRPGDAGGRSGDAAAR